MAAVYGRRELLREPVEDPRRVERLEPVRPPADVDVVARLRVHREARLDGIPAVVLLDQLVHLGEVPALARPAPVAGPLRVRLGEAREVELDLRLDLAQAPHVRERAAQRREVRVRLGPEVADAPAQGPADERVELPIRLEQLALHLRRRRDVADPPLADDLFRRT